MSLAAASAAAVAYWSMNESSGTRVDTINGLNLASFNSTGSASGKFDLAASFVPASSNYLQRNADDAVLSGGDVYLVFRAWITLSSKADLACVFGKMGDSTGTNREYMLRYDNGTDRLVLFVFDASGATTVSADNFGSIPLDTLILVHCGHDPVSNIVWISINAGTRNTAAHSTGIFNGPNFFTVGGQQTGTLSSELQAYYAGLIDDLVVMRDYDFTTADATADYNGGTGIVFTSWATGTGNPWNYYQQEHAAAV